MPIPVASKISRVKGRVRIVDLGLPKGEEWIAWWYCGVKKNLRANSQPLVLVDFRHYSDQGIAETPQWAEVPIALLAQVGLGSIWKNGRLVKELELKERELTIDFTLGKWKYANFQTTGGESEPFPQAIHQLRYERDKNWLLVFDLGNRGNLVVPCLEFFTRCYGRSAEVRRVLATYPWDEIVNGTDGRLYVENGEPDESGKWKIRLKKRMHNGDVVFLAHLKHDSYARHAARMLYKQIENGFEVSDLIQVQVKPWFEGAAKLLVRGYEFGEAKSFLGLQILGCSDPRGLDVHYSRENDSNVDPNGEGTGTQGSWGGTAIRNTLQEPPDIIDLTGSSEPDSGSDTIEVDDPDFVVLGGPRRVVRKATAHSGSTQGKKLQEEESSTFASGEPYGGGKGIGYANIGSQIVMESKGALRDVWNALRELGRLHPQTVTAVEWYEGKEEFNDSDDPSLITLTPFPENADVDAVTRKWVFLVPGRQAPRGVLLARIRVKGKFVYFAEIQRRPRKIHLAGGLPSDKEETYRGFVCTLANDKDFRPWLDEFLGKLRVAKGIVSVLVTECRGEAIAFKHSKSEKDSVMYLNCIRNVLWRIGIEF